MVEGERKRGEIPVANGVVVFVARPPTQLQLLAINMDTFGFPNSNKMQADKCWMCSWSLLKWQG